MNKQVLRGLSVAGVLGSVLGAANAAAPDVTAITDAGASVGIVGAAVFAVYVGVKLFKWIRAAL